ncbi:MAG: hypothetical protein JWO32_1025 [Bacteroidetes bacterium]|nr:hypothetical protein [Bacteroidota bacterium]
MFSNFIFNCPWYFILPCLLCGVAFAGLLYYHNKKNNDVPGNVLYVMTFLRFLSSSFITFLLLNVFFRQLKNETQNPIILLALDNSRSIPAGPDSSYIRNEFLPNLNSFKKELNKDYSLKTILFGNTSGISEEAPDFSEKETDIDNLISDIENNYSNQNIGALILVSDGIYNKGANPVYNAEKLQFPVYTIGLGDTTELRDVAIQKINHNQFAYSGNIFPVEVILSSKKYLGKMVTVSLTEPNGKVLTQEVKVNSENFLGTLTFTLNATVPGIQHYHVKTSIQEGEKNVSNNHQSFVIEVIDNRSKILLLANYPHPDVSAIKEAILSNGNYGVEYGLIPDFKKPIKPYSLVIIHGYSAANEQLFSDCKNNTIPVWIVDPSTNENLPGVKISGALNRQNEAEAVYNKSFGLFTISEELKKFIHELPAVKTAFGNYSLNNGSHSLINQKIGVVETENPAFLYSELNGMKTAVFIGDGLWKWKMRDFAEHNNTNLFNELISKTIQYLSVKSDKSFFRITSPKVVNENETVEIDAEVYNKSYELITEPDVTLILTNNANKQFNYTFSKSSNGYRLNLGFLPSGEYKYEAKVKIDNEIFVKKESILVKEIIAEKINTVANHQLLHQISSHTGGKLFYPSELKKLKEEILKNQLIKPITYSTNLTTNIIDLKWMFLIILIILSTEWFLRKRYSSI